MESQLPLQPTPFIGRDRELRELTKLLSQPENRLISVLGLGGIGKTRLALAVAERQQEIFGKCIYFVSVVALNSWEQVALAIAQAIDFQLYQDTPISEQIVSYLRDKRVLLLLDSVEELLP